MQALLDTLAALDRPHATQRVFHGRGGLHPGCEHLCLDFFAPVWLLTSFKPLAPDELGRLHQALQNHAERHGMGLHWVYQCRAPGASLTQVQHGAVPDPHVVEENGARYTVHLTKGQNHGLFLDMAAGRAWVRAHAAQHPGLQVLNLFAYTCGFSVAALQGGAAGVLNVDMAAGAIATGQQNHALNGLQGRARFMAHDIFKTWGKIKRGGPYGLVIIDPPSHQKGSFVATQDYRKLLRKLPELLEPDGRVLLCLNAPELDSAFLHHHMAQEAPGFVFERRLDNPTVFADTDPERALKVLLYRKATASD